MVSRSGAVKNFLGRRKEENLALSTLKEYMTIRLVSRIMSYTATHTGNRRVEARYWLGCWKTDDMDESALSNEGITRGRESWVPLQACSQDDMPCIECEIGRRTGFSKENIWDRSLL